MKTIIKLLAVLLLTITILNPTLAQTQIGQDITGTRAEYSYNCPSLSFDGNRMAVAFTDRVKVYELVNNIWQQIGSDVITGGSPEVSLSADGDRFAITIYNPEIGRVYDFINGDWVQVGADFDLIVNAYSFQKVAISPDGNRVALGAMKGNTVEVRELNGGNWVPIGSRLTGESVFDRFGSSVAVSWDGSVLAAGAITNDGNGNSSVYRTCTNI